MDASWGELIQYTAYKAESADKQVILVDPRNRSRMHTMWNHAQEVIDARVASVDVDDEGASPSIHWAEDVTFAKIILP